MYSVYDGSNVKYQPLSAKNILAMKRIADEFEKFKSGKSDVDSLFAVLSSKESVNIIPFLYIATHYTYQSDITTIIPDERLDDIFREDDIYIYYSLMLKSNNVTTSDKKFSNLPKYLRDEISKYSFYPSGGSIRFKGLSNIAWPKYKSGPEGPPPF